MPGGTPVPIAKRKRHGLVAPCDMTVPVAKEIWQQAGRATSPFFEISVIFKVEWSRSVTMVLLVPSHIPCFAYIYPLFFPIGTQPLHTISLILVLTLFSPRSLFPCT